MNTGSKHDVVALLSIAVSVGAGGIGALLLFTFAIAPRLFGSLDAPLHGTKTLAVIGCVLLVLVAGGVAGGLLWVLIAGRLLPRATVIKWLAYGPQFPPLTRLSLRLLNLVSHQKADVPPAA